MTDDEMQLLVRVDSLCSLILYRENTGLSELTKRELKDLVTDLRTLTQPRRRVT